MENSLNSLPPTGRWEAVDMARTGTDADIDPAVEDPTPQLDAWRRDGRRVVRSEAMGGAWLVLGHPEVRAVLDDPETFSSAYALGGPPARTLPPAVVAELPAFLREDVSGVVDVDLPDHDAPRATVLAAWSGPRVKPLAGTVRALARELAAALASRERADLVADYALPLVHRTMAAAMRVPEAEVPRVAAWAQDMATVLSPGPEEPKAEAARRLREYERWAAAFLRTVPPGGEGVLSVYLHGQGEGPGAAPPMTYANVVHNLLVHWVAGTVTTAHAISGTCYELLRRRELWEWARQAPHERARHAVEETFRHAAPHRGLVRVTTRECPLAGHAVPAGSMVFPLLGSANRDETRVRDALTFDPDRPEATPHGHLAFGHGVHACPGANLARLEARTAVAELLTALPDLALAEGDGELPPPRLPSLHFDGLAALPVEPGNGGRVEA
ncbi:cytochrome P450 [Streptomyces albiaxialis]|uniref:Cytochrome P450 n=1 Tax=Streptomyces albiaxialis TaxID=329523 RepID=A0ABN2VQX3_9ACTN